MSNGNNVSVTFIVPVFSAAVKFSQLLLVPVNYIRKYIMYLLELCLEGQILMFKGDYQNKTTNSN